MTHFTTRILLPFVIIIFCYNSNAFQKHKSFEEDSSKAKVLIFLSQSCPCSKSHVEHLNELNSKYKDVAFYGVITNIIDNDTAKSIEEYFISKNFNFPIIRDDSQFLIKKYGALKTPHVTLLTKSSNGEFKQVYEGGVTDNREFAKSKSKFLADNLESLAAKQPLKHTQGKSLGCHIQRI